MLKRLNYTGRRKLEAHRVVFALAAEGAGGEGCTARFDFDGLDLPADASVVVQVHRAFDTEVVRSDLGAPGALRRGVDLGGFRAEDKLFFDVLVADPSSRRLLAVRRGVRPGEPDEGGRLPLFAVEVRDLGPEPWKTEVDADGAKLVLNASWPNAMERIRTAGEFQSLVLGAAFRQVLLRLWAEDVQAEDEPDPDGWQAKWLAFATPLAGWLLESWNDPLQALKWIDDACLGFAQRNNLAADGQTREAA